MRFLVLFLGGLGCSDLPSCFWWPSVFGLSDLGLSDLGRSLLAGEDLPAGRLALSDELLAPATFLEAAILPLVPLGIFRS